MTEFIVGRKRLNLNNPKERPQEKLAKLVSAVFNPVVFAVGILIVLGILLGNTLDWYSAVIMILFSVGIPVGFLLRQLSHGKVTDFFMQLRQQRDVFYLITFFSMLVGSILLLILGIPQLLKYGLCVALIQIAGMGIINKVWKISAHSSTAALLCCLLLFAFGWKALPAFLLVPLVSWSRIALRRHTVMQTVVGALGSTANFFLVALFFYPSMHL